MYSRLFRELTVSRWRRGSPPEPLTDQNGNEIARMEALRDRFGLDRGPSTQRLRLNEEVGDIFPYYSARAEKTQANTGTNSNYSPLRTKSVNNSCLGAVISINWLQLSIAIRFRRSSCWRHDCCLSRQRVPPDSYRRGAGPHTTTETR